jgi:hypothetical protein
MDPRGGRRPGLRGRPQLAKPDRHPARQRRPLPEESLDSHDDRIGRNLTSDGRFQEPGFDPRSRDRRDGSVRLAIERDHDLDPVDGLLRR